MNCPISKSLRRGCFFLIAVILGLASAHAQSAMQRNMDSFYRENSSLSVNELSLRGYQAITGTPPDPELALAYLTLAASKYDPSLSDIQQHNAVVSMSNIGYIYLFYYRNPELAYPWLSKAENIAVNGPKFLKRALSSIYDNFAKIYDDYGDSHRSLQLYKKSYGLAVSFRDKGIMTLTLNDAVNLAFHAGMLDSIAPELRHFPSLQLPDSLPLARYSKMLCRGLICFIDGRYDESYDLLYRATPYIDSTTDNWRYVANHYRYLSAVALARRDVATSLRMLREAKRIAVSYDLADMVPKLYMEISKAFSNAGVSDSAAFYKLRALEAKDSLYTASSFGRIKDFEASDILGDMQDTMKKADASHRKRLSYLWMAFAAIVVAIVFIVIIVNRNRKLAAGNKALVRQNLETLRSQEIDRRMIKEFEEKLVACETRMQEVEASGGVESPLPGGDGDKSTGEADGSFSDVAHGNDRIDGADSYDTDCDEDALSAGCPDDAATGHGDRHDALSRRRLASIPLDDDAVLRLAASVKQIMATSKEILSPDFSLETLSDMTDTKPTYLSKVINTVLKKNFNQLLAEARIAEACRRMLDDKNYATRSLDAIAEDVGYRSRSYFSTVFKKVTGLTPAKYVQIANDPDFDKDNITN